MEKCNSLTSGETQQEYGEDIYFRRYLFCSCSQWYKQRPRTESVRWISFGTDSFFISLWPGLIWDRVHSLCGWYTAVLYIQCEDNFDGTLMFWLLLISA